MWYWRLKRKVRKNARLVMREEETMTTMQHNGFHAIPSGGFRMAEDGRPQIVPGGTAPTVAR